MSQEIDLKQIERRTYLTLQQDGIWDLFVGLALVGVSIGLLTKTPGTTAILPILAIILAPIVKRAMTLPRLGYVKFSPERQSKQKRNLNAMTVLFTLTALLGLVVFYAYLGDAGWQKWIRGLGLIPLGFVLALAALVLGLLYGVRRCLYYAALAMAAFIASHLLDMHPSVKFMVIGGVLSVTGAILLTRFVRKYPRPSREQSDVR
ncbi:MAG: hypothetical protein JSW34_10280 [Candidatus Zixiibacteriota bacterium]|nr:MAG: hypothetical protein JSW34_10280 [candidate division Zixibacteria bacterium]